MFHAEAAAMRSAALGRQVGAIIASESGDIVAVGTNEVPRAGGGLYWPGDEPDQRDFRLGYDTNDRMKRNLIAEVFERLKRRRWLSEVRSRRSVERLVNDALRDRRLLGDAQVMNLLEFGRAVHAEMAAFVDAARRGVSVQGSTLYTTTFPCHECARHIVAASVTRVVYVHPYPKSLAAELYLDSVIVDPKEPLAVAQVAFQPFVGVAPRMYLPLFRVGEDARKDKQGNIKSWEGTRTATVPKAAAEPYSYINAEKGQLNLLRERVRAAGMRLVG
jgi:cytidine deaminase